MRMVEILLEIRGAEQKMKLMKEEALKEKDRIIEDADEEADQLIKNAQISTKNFYEDLVETAGEKIRIEREKIIEDGLKEADHLKKNADMQVERVVDYLVEKFERYVLEK